MDQIFQKVREIIEDLLSLQPNEVEIEDNLKDELGADSLDMVDILLLIEETFDVEIPDEECDKFKSVQDICTYLDTNTEG